MDDRKDGGGARSVEKGCVGRAVAGSAAQKRHDKDKEGHEVGASIAVVVVQRCGGARSGTGAADASVVQRADERARECGQRRCVQRAPGHATEQLQKRRGEPHDPALGPDAIARHTLPHARPAPPQS